MTQTMPISSYTTSKAQAGDVRDRRQNRAAKNAEKRAKREQDRKAAEDAAAICAVTLAFLPRRPEAWTGLDLPVYNDYYCTRDIMVKETLRPTDLHPTHDMRLAKLDREHNLPDGTVVVFEMFQGKHGGGAQISVFRYMKHTFGWVSLVSSGNGMFRVSLEHRTLRFA